MNVPRAQELLNAASTGAGYGGSRDETLELVQARLLEPHPSAQRDQLASRAGQLEQAAARVRELRRSLDQTRGPKVPAVVFGLPPTHDARRTELLSQMQQMAELSREATLLKALVPDGAGDYVLVSSEGRRVVTKLSVWASRYAAGSLSDFVGALTYTDNQLKAVLTRGAILVQSVIAEETAQTRAWFPPSDDAEMSDPDLVVDQGTRTQARGVALTLAKANLSPGEVYADFIATSEQVGQLGVPAKEVDVVASILMSNPLGSAAALQRFRAIQAIVSTSYGRVLETSLPAAILADLPPASDTWLGARFAQIMTGIPNIGPAEYAILTRSPYQVAVILQRYQAASDTIRKLGYAPDPAGVTAAVLLAVSPHPTDRFLPRIAFIDDRLREVIASPAASGILAANPLAPEEAWDFFQGCVGAVTRSGFFDVTAEIDYLALLLSLDPGPFLSSAIPSATFVPGVDLPPPASLQASAFVAYHMQVYPRFVVWSAAHPVHFHSVPAFG
jgi:hypothetical protein